MVIRFVCHLCFVNPAARFDRFEDPVLDFPGVAKHVGDGRVGGSLIEPSLIDSGTDLPLK